MVPTSGAALVRMPPLHCGSCAFTPEQPHCTKRAPHIRYRGRWSYPTCEPGRGGYLAPNQKTAKGGHKITFKMEKMLDAKDIQSMPGFQLCCSCFEEAQTHCHNVSEVEGYVIAIASDSHSSEAEEDPCEKHPKIDLGDSCQSISISPSKPTA